MTSENLSDLLGIFRVVVDSGSFSAAGRILNISPAWVAKQVTRLEAVLGASLLIRSTRALRLTDAGQECYRTASIVADELTWLKDKLCADSKAITGVVRLNVPSIIAQDVIAEHISEFQMKYPSIKLDIVVSDSFSDVLNEDVDIIFRVSRALEDSTAVTQQVSFVPRVLCASKDYLSRTPKIETSHDVKGHKALVFDSPQSSSEWFLRCREGQEWIAPNVVLRANNSFVLKRAAISGAGIAFLPKVIVESELITGQLIHLDQIEDADPFKLFLLRAPRKHLPKRVQIAWRFFAQACKDKT
ncbi:LysR family transcriptional regulator [Pseudovibrio sp. Ad37]|uniref:LysR family transcriptional regulator n=1 Tax=Pseudovibrio sp. Ad37 TaxID=989422 RepID=UPI0007AEBA76|nr:LysR family transcriptional regulator [Pseudovibrio sp. Ad37]KZL13806.1 HTH-type transcriptional regulator DmlR [Pseudovibrio sp. Ad37]